MSLASQFIENIVRVGKTSSMLPTCPTDRSGPDLMLITIHIATGSISLIAAAVALFARKGSSLHRGSGLLFVTAMLAMSASAMPLAVSVQKPTSVMGGALTFYLVLTSLLSIRRPQQRFDVVVLMFYWILRVQFGKGYRKANR